MKMETIMPVELDDGIRPFIEHHMQLIDSSIYTPEELSNYFQIPHKNLAYINKIGKIVAFCCIMVKSNSFKMCYTWCDGTMEGRKAYAKGIDYMIENYSPMEFAMGAMKLNKIKRIC